MSLFIDIIQTSLQQHKQPILLLNLVWVLLHQLPDTAIHRFGVKCLIGRYNHLVEVSPSHALRVLLEYIKNSIVYTMRYWFWFCGHIKERAPHETLSGRVDRGDQAESASWRRRRCGEERTLSALYSPYICFAIAISPTLQATHLPGGPAPLVHAPVL